MNAHSDFSGAESACVFLYHAVVNEVPANVGWRERKYWMTAGEFKSQLAFLAACAHPVLDLECLLRAPAARPRGDSLFWPGPRPAPAILTFDDGRASDGAIVWPLLREAGLPATFFVNTATLGRPGHLRWRDLREMSAAGASLGSHGHHHVDFTRLTSRALEMELRMSKDLIEGWIRRPVDFFAAPFGRVNERVVDAALAAGYGAVCTSAPGAARAGATRISRIAIHAGTAPESLSKWLAGSLAPYWARRARAACLALPKRLLPAPGARSEIRPGAAL
jgi:peptidoglycan/xylan/chitin deacetylase (PgdA/CDA1 family)